MSGWLEADGPGQPTRGQDADRAGWKPAIPGPGAGTVTASGRLEEGDPG